MADLFQDVFDLFGPNKWFWIFVVDQNKFIDRRDQLRYASENASPDPLARDLSEPSLYKVHPRRTRRRKVQMKSGMLLKPLPHIGVLVCPVVVQNQVQGQSLWRFSVDLAQELQELLVSMTRVTGADHGAVWPACPNGHRR